jgi:hypothetical protein
MFNVELAEVAESLIVYEVGNSKVEPVIVTVPLSIVIVPKPLPKLSVLLPIVVVVADKLAVAPNIDAEPVKVNVATSSSPVEVMLIAVLSRADVNPFP